jgi:ABC-type dipeptide/oligopeptide/nickel transport system ATPase subunit
MVFQNPAAVLNPLQRVRSLIVEPARVHGRPPKAGIDARLDEVLALVHGRTSWLSQYPHQLSGGELQRVALARALMTSPSVLLADEPVAGLDVVLQAEIVSILAEAAKPEGRALVVISHDLVVVERLCREILVMAEGRVIETLIVGDAGIRPSHPVSRALFAGSHMRRVE